MIDFHTHILPCVDDGSQSISESVTLLREEAKQGIDTVILTPHYYANEQSPETFLQRRDRAWNQLRPYLWPELPRVLFGAEVQYFEGICTAEEICRLRIQDTKYLLLEMPFSHWPDRVVEDVVTLSKDSDTIIVLAHIERYMDKQEKDVWDYLRNYGVLMQANISFFESWKTRHRAMSMLSRGELHFLGSDCHNKKSRRPNWDSLPNKAKELVRKNPAYLEFEKAITLDSTEEFDWETLTF